MKTESENNSKQQLSGNGTNGASLDQLLGQLKERDEKQKQVYRRFSTMYWVLLVFFLLLLVVNPDPELSINHRISGLCYMIAFFIGINLFRREKKAIETIDYSESLLMVMKEAAERYHPLKGKSLHFILIPLLVNIGLTLSGPMDYMPESWNYSEKIIALQVVYWIVIVIAAVVGYFIWMKRSRPYRDAVKKMISDLES